MLPYKLNPVKYSWLKCAGHTYGNLILFIHIDDVSAVADYGLYLPVRIWLIAPILYVFYTNITELTEELLHTLIEKVVVHEKEVIDGETVMRIDIYYRFIGKVGNEKVEALKATKSRWGSMPLAPGA